MRLRVKEIDKFERDVKLAYIQFKRAVTEQHTINNGPKYEQTFHGLGRYIADNFGDGYLYEDITKDQMRRIENESYNISSSFSKDEIDIDCEAIRAICEPVAVERDAFISMLYKSPSREELDDICEWVEKYRQFHEPKCSE